MIQHELRTRNGDVLFTSSLPTLAQRLESALLNGVAFRDMELTFHDLAHVNLDGAIFQKIHFFECNLSGGNLSECRFENCAFSYCDLTDTCFCYTDFSNCVFHHNTYTETDISEARFVDCTFRGSIYTGPKRTECYEMLRCKFEQPLVEHISIDSLRQKIIGQEKFPY